MHKKHQACLSQLACNGKALLRAPFKRKRLFQIDLTATPTEAGDSLGVDRLNNSIAGPFWTKNLWTNKGIILVIGMLNVLWWHRNTQARQGRELAGQDLCVSAPNGKPLEKFPQLYSANR
jgi:hypothetical protein